MPKKQRILIGYKIKIPVNVLAIKGNIASLFTEDACIPNIRSITLTNAVIFHRTTI